MVAPAQFRGRFTGKLGVSACHPRLLPRVARALWHALDDDGGACRRCSSSAGTEWYCSRVKARLATSGLRSWPMRPSRPEICYARLERALPETNRGWVAKFAGPVYRATGQRQTINPRGNEFGREVVTPQSHRSPR